MKAPSGQCSRALAGTLFNHAQENLVHAAALGGSNIYTNMLTFRSAPLRGSLKVARQLERSMETAVKIKAWANGLGVRLPAQIIARNRAEFWLETVALIYTDAGHFLSGNFSLKAPLNGDLHIWR